MSDVTGRESLSAAPNETVTITGPEGHETGGKIEVTYWQGGEITLNLDGAQGRLKITHIEMYGPQIRVGVERDW